MVFNQRNEAEPTGLQKIDTLQISSLNDNFEASQTVCIGFNKTLAYIFSKDEAAAVNPAWMDQAIELKTDDQPNLYVIPRPGAGELLRRLYEEVAPIFYSRCDYQVLDQARLQLSIAEGDPDDCSDPFLDGRAWAWMKTPIWAKEQCVKTDDVLEKSLGHLCSHIESQINDTWLIDHKSDHVDFPSHVLEVPEFLGNPYDRHLYNLMDRIFNN